MFYIFFDSYLYYGSKIVIYHRILKEDVMKDLPRVTPGKIKDNLHNTQDIFYGSDRKAESHDSLSVI